MSFLVAQTKQTQRKGYRSLHQIPFWNDERPEAKRMRKIWMNFVATKRAKWTPSKFSAACSKYFIPEDYEKYLVEMIPGTRDYTPRLKDETVIVVYPSKFTRSNLADEVSHGNISQVMKHMGLACIS